MKQVLKSKNVYYVQTKDDGSSSAVSGMLVLYIDDHDRAMLDFRVEPGAGRKTLQVTKSLLPAFGEFAFGAVEAAAELAKSFLIPDAGKRLFYNWRSGGGLWGDVWDDLTDGVDDVIMAFEDNFGLEEYTSYLFSEPVQNMEIEFRTGDRDSIWMQVRIGEQAHVFMLDAGKSAKSTHQKWQKALTLHQQQARQSVVICASNVLYMTCENDKMSDDIRGTLSLIRNAAGKQILSFSPDAPDNAPRTGPNRPLFHCAADELVVAYGSLELECGLQLMLMAAATESPQTRYAFLIDAIPSLAQVQARWEEHLGK